MNESELISEGDALLWEWLDSLSVMDRLSVITYLITDLSCTTCSSVRDERAAIIESLEVGQGV